MAGKIPQQFIDDLLTRIDIVDVIDARVPLRKAGKDFVARCPFHEEKSPSFTVSQDKQFYHCFGCGVHGTAIGFLMDYDHMEFIDAVHELASSLNLEVPVSIPDQHAKTADKGQYEILLQAARYFQRQLREHPARSMAIDYLKCRGLNGDMAAKFGIGFAPPGWDNLLKSLGTTISVREQLAATGMLITKENGEYHDRFRNRIMFPIRDRRGRVVGFGGRVLNNKSGPKYLNSPETGIFHKGQELYGLYEARKSQRQLDRLLAVEGYMDVIMLTQYGIPYAVASLGTAITPLHLDRMFRTVHEVVFCLDGDSAGREAAWRSLENVLAVMREGRQARFMFLPEGEDPDSLIRKEGKVQFEQRIVRSVTLSSFFFENLQKKVDISSIDGRARLTELAKPLLAKLPPGVFKQMMLTQLADVARMETGTLARLLEVTDRRSDGYKTQTKRQDRTAPSLIRNAISMLIQYPALAGIAGEPKRLATLQIPGINLLIELLEFIQRNPHLSTGAIVEHWRGCDEGRTLAKLATQELVIQEAMDKEFSDLIQRLEQLHLQQRVDYLSSKSLKDLTIQEKSELRQLLTSHSRSL
jgi:DNA primase